MNMNLGRTKHQKQNKKELWGAPWVAQSVKRLTLAQIRISLLVSLSSASGFVLTAQNLETALDSVSSSLSAPPLLIFCVCLSPKNK